MSPALLLGLQTETSNQEGMGWTSGLQMPEAETETNTT